MLKPQGKGLLALLLRLLLSAVFFITALFKVHPIQYFEFTLVETGWIGWDPAAILARGIIGVEFAISVLLLLGTQRRSVLKGVFVFLALMSLYLLVLLVQKGNVADCGCLGGHGSITPVMSLLKNAGMMGGVLLIAYLGGGPAVPFYPKLISTLVLLGGIAVPFIVSPIESMQAKYQPDQKLKDFPAEKLRTLSEEKVKGHRLDSGKKILAFMSTRCHWCQLAARKMRIMDRRTQRDLPFHFFLHGNEASEKRFWEKARSAPYPSTLLSMDPILEFADRMVPAVVFWEDGVPKARFHFKGIDQERFLAFLRAESPS